MCLQVLLLAAFISCIMRKPDINDDEEENFDDVNAVNTCRSTASLSDSQRDLQGTDDDYLNSSYIDRLSVLWVQ